MQLKVSDSLNSNVDRECTISYLSERDIAWVNSILLENNDVFGVIPLDAHVLKDPLFVSLVLHSSLDSMVNIGFVISHIRTPDNPLGLLYPSNLSNDFNNIEIGHKILPLLFENQDFYYSLCYAEIDLNFIHPSYQKLGLSKNLYYSDTGLFQTLRNNDINYVVSDIRVDNLPPLKRALKEGRLIIGVTLFKDQFYFITLGRTDFEKIPELGFDYSSRVIESLKDKIPLSQEVINLLNNYLS